MSIGDWAKFVTLHLQAARGAPRLLKTSTFARLHALKDDYKKPVEGVEIVDYDGWVRLLEYCNKTACWT
jgi:hypothetical protein